MINVNGIEITLDNNLLELSFNIHGDADKEYKWNELSTILSRIPGEYTILYDTGSVWDTKNEVKYIFDTFSETDIFTYDFQSIHNEEEADNHNIDEFIFSVLPIKEHGPISCRDYVNKLNTAWSYIPGRYLIVEYFHLVLIRTGMVEY